MKKVILKSLELTNWKGEAHRVTEFSEVQTTLSGRNQAGKSRHMDAFLWLLFGKDQLDRKDHEIYTKVDGRILEKVDATVCGVIEVDKVEQTLTRTFRQKWVRKRGAEEETYEGNETVYELNGVSVKASEYKAFVEDIVSESIFKLITNPLYFLNQAWKDQREVLFQIAGVISDAEVLEKMATSNKDAVANLTNIINQGKNLEQFKKEIAAKRLKMNKELLLVQPRIDQTIKMMPEEVNFEAFRKELESIDSQIKAIDSKLQDISDSDKEIHTKNRARQTEINALKVRQQEIELNARTTAQEDVYKQNGKRRELVEALKEANEELAKFSSKETERIQKFKSLSLDRKELEDKLANLYKEWQKINEKVFTEDDICPYCKQAVPPKENAREEFEDKREAEFKVVNDKGIRLSKEMAEVDRKLAYVSEVGNKQPILEKIADLNERLKNTPHVAPAEVVKEELPEWQAIQAQIIVLEKAVEVIQTDTSALEKEKADLVAERDDLKLMLNEEKKIAESKAEVDRLNAEAKALASEIAMLEKQEMQIASFTRIKIEESETRINSMFQLANFKLFDTTFDGNEFEVCIPTNKDGVPVSTVNSAQRTNIGLDIINVLCKFNNISAPIFVDNREGVNTLIETESQIINLVVTTDDFKVKHHV